MFSEPKKKLYVDLHKTKAKRSRTKTNKNINYNIIVIYYKPNIVFILLYDVSYHKVKRKNCT